jgi:hypothetical protein
MEDQIIDRIVQEVLARLNKPDDQPPKETGTLAIVASQAVMPQAAIETLEKKFAGIRYAVLQSDFGPDGIEKLSAEDLQEKNLLSVAAASENIVLISPPLWVLEKIARGEDNGFVEYLMLRSILWEKKVFVLLDFMIPRFKRNTFFEKLSDATAALTDMGVGILQYGCFNREMDKKLTLVTEKEVAEAAKQHSDRINCAPRAIVTPAARDRAAELNIKIDG